MVEKKLPFHSYDRNPAPRSFEGSSRNLPYGGASASFGFAPITNDRAEFLSLDGAIARGHFIRERDLRDGIHDTVAVSRYFDDSVEAVVEAERDHRVFSVTGPNDERVFPSIQFCEAGPIEGLKPVIESLETGSPWAWLNFLNNPDARLDGRRPIDVLREGNVALVVMAAKAYGVQGH